MQVTLRVDMRLDHSSWREVGTITIDDFEDAYGRDGFPLSAMAMGNSIRLGHHIAEVRVTRIH